jgi:CRP-like cAMP-binding protein
VPLLDGIPEAGLVELARLLRRRDVPAGTVLWRQGDEAEAMLLIVDGRVSVSLRLPGDRAVEVASLGRGEPIGEIPCSTAGATRQPLA